MREIEDRLARVEKIERRSERRGAKAPAGVPADMTRAYPPDVRHDDARIPGRPDPHLHLYDRKRRQQPQLQRHRRARGPPRYVAPRRRPVQAGAGRQDQQVPRGAGRLLPGEAAVDQRAGRHAAGQLHDRLWRGHQRRRPPQPRRPADPAGGRGRGHDQAGRHVSLPDARR